MKSFVIIFLHIIMIPSWKNVRKNFQQSLGAKLKVGLRGPQSDLSSVRPNPLFSGSAETETETRKTTETEPKPNRTCVIIFATFLTFYILEHNSYWCKISSRSIFKLFKQRFSNFAILFYFLVEIFLLEVIFSPIFKIFKVINWSKFHKRFGLGSVKFSLVSAETETSTKLLVSAETETESKGSVVH